MLRSAYYKVICSSLFFVTTLFGTSTLSIHAQCVDSVPGIPMWEIYGINPFQPRSWTPPSFTPLQAQSVQTAAQIAPVNDFVCCAVPMYGQVYLCEASMQNCSVTANLNSLDRSTELASVIDGEVSKGKSTLTEQGSISSPSDILVAPKSEGEPTRAAVPSKEMRAELESARNEIDRLKNELRRVRSKLKASAE